MSLYAQAVQSGMEAAHSLFGDSATEKAAFNQGYKSQADKIAAANAKNVAEKNIAAAKQDTMLSNVHIQMNQDKAEAMARVNAAASGSEGSSVQDVIYDTEKNEAFAVLRTKRKESQRIESQVARVNNAQSALLSVREHEQSLTGDLLGAFSSLEEKDIDAMEAFFNAPTGVGV